MSLLFDGIGAAFAWLKSPSISLSRRFFWTGYSKPKEVNVDLKHFNEKEDPLIVGLSENLLLMLDSARDAAGEPFFITSGKRSAEENSVLKGAVADSSHLSGLAVDLHVEDQFHLFAMLLGLTQAGFTRIGIYYSPAPDNPKNLIPKHLHVDIDLDKPQDIVFTKLEQN